MLGLGSERGTRRFVAATLIAALCASAAIAHQGVRNPAVLARMENMSAIADEMETLVNMARGTVAFDATLADTSLARLADLTGEVEALFRAPEVDPAMEALPVIWEDFADFSDKAHAMQRAVDDVSGRLTSREDLVTAVRDLGAACAACHDIYRQAN